MGPEYTDPLLAFGGALAIKVIEWIGHALTRARREHDDHLAELPARNATRLDRIERDVARIREHIAGISAVLHLMADRHGWPRPPSMSDRPRSWGDGPES